MRPVVEATVEALYKIRGKAEIVNGRIVHLSPAGGLPAYAARQITIALSFYEKATGRGVAIGDNTAFVVNLPHRKSFSPDAAFYAGKLTMKFGDGVPTFAVEVRSDGDYGPRAERQMAAKRDDYFAAGTLVVWDVDLLSNDVVRVYRASDPQTPTIYKPGEFAEAEPALPGWTMPVDDLFFEKNEL